MYGIQGIDDEEALRQLLGATPLDDVENFQPQQTQVQQGLLGDSGEANQLIQALANSDAAAQLAQWGQQAGANNGTGQQRLANQRAQSQQAAQQAASNRGFLGNLFSNAANMAVGNWLGGMMGLRRK